MILNKYFSMNKVIKYLSFFTIFILVIISTVSSIGCGQEKQPDVIDFDKMIEFKSSDEKIDMKQQIFSPIEITLLHTNDIRGYIQPCGCNPRQGGVARRATVINEIESQKENVIILDAGSALSGHYETDYSKGEIMINFMNLLGYDAMSAGVWDLKYQMDEILNLREKAEFPILSANLISRQDKARVFDAYTIIETSGRNIAIIGISPYPLGESLTGEIVKEYKTTEPVKAINEIIAEVKSKANIIVVLSAAGRERDEKIASSIDDIDIIVSSSSNLITNEPFVVERKGKSNALIVESMVIGKKLGKLIVNFSPDGEIEEFEGELLWLGPEVEDEPEIAKILKEYLEQMKK